MWLGEQFFEKTGANKTRVMSADWLKTEEIGNTVKLIAADTPFVSAEGQSGELQNRLRTLLYSPRKP
jgi:hypothetical protein